jgi:hypothetical protein
MRIPVNIRRFRVQGLTRRRLPLPTATNLRIAHIGGATWFDGVRVFPSGAWKDIEAYRPRVMVGSASDLQEIAHLTRLGSVELSSVDHAVLVLTSLGDQPLTDVARVVLWQSFGVPVYELLISPRGSLLASECEAHDGLHVEPGAAFSQMGDELVLEASGRRRVRTGLSGRLESEVCACGREGIRLLDIEPYSSRVLQQLAATA